MTNLNYLYGIVNISSGFLFILLSIPLVANKIPMNRLYGFRLSKSYVSDENCLKINSYGAKQLIYWSILIIFIGIAYFFFPMQNAQNEGLSAFLAKRQW